MKPSQIPSAESSLLLSGGMRAMAKRWPTKTAILYEDRMLTYGALVNRIGRLCGGALVLGVQPGDRVAVLAPNCIEYPEIIMGLSDAGAIVATLNPRSTASEISAACRDCGARFLFVHPSLEAVAHAAQIPTLERTIILGEEYEAWLAASPEAAPSLAITEADAFGLVYSSGTTGAPKGILLSHRSRTLTFHAMAIEYGCFGPRDRQLVIAPMAHGAGLVSALAALYFGGTIDLLGKFEPELVVRKLAMEPVTGVFMVPTHFQSVFALEASTLERFRGRAAALRVIKSNAAALPYAVKRKIIAYWGEGKLHESYGSTEGGVITNLRPEDQLRVPGSVGPAFGLNQIELLDGSGAPVPKGSTGELYTKSPYLFSGYWQRPEETSQAVRDGWVSAGDLARQDEEGFYYIVDRKKDMVVSGGINVYPREIEETLYQHPAVQEAAVIGVPDDHWGEAPIAYIVLRAGMSVDPGELAAHCRKTLAGYKIPKAFRIIASLPRSASGKVLKTELRTRI